MSTLIYIEIWDKVGVSTNTIDITELYHLEHSLPSTLGRTYFFIISFLHLRKLYVAALNIYII